MTKKQGDSAKKNANFLFFVNGGGVQMKILVFGGTRFCARN